MIITFCDSEECVFKVYISYYALKLYEQMLKTHDVLEKKFH